MKTLKDTKPGETVTLVKYHDTGDVDLRRHLLGMGFVKGAKITVKKQTPSLTVPAKSYGANAKTKTISATFKSASGKVIAGKKITFTVNGKTYTANTNDKGVASVNVSLNKKGTYSFTAKFAGDNTYAAISKTAKLTLK